MARPDYDSKSSRPTSFSPEWMAKVPDDVNLAELSIPGTHDTMSTRGKHLFDKGGPVTWCQTWDLSDQLSAGIRFLDIRCRHISDAFSIHHGRVYLKKNFDDVLTCVFRFLENNPSEAVLMRVRKEHNEEKVSKSFRKTFDRYVDDYGKEKFWLERHVPKMKEGRGKVVILREFDSEGNTRGIPWGVAVKADEWTVPTILKKHIDNKWDNIRGNLEKAQHTSGGRGGLYISFCSGASAGAYPNAVADRVNPRMHKYISENYGKKKFGVVVLDFPGRELIQRLIVSNFG